MAQHSTAQRRNRGILQHSAAELPQVKRRRVVLQQVKDEFIVDLAIGTGHIPLFVWLFCLQTSTVLSDTVKWHQIQTPSNKASRLVKLLAGSINLPMLATQPLQSCNGVWVR